MPQTSGNASYELRQIPTSQRMHVDEPGCVAVTPHLVIYPEPAHPFNMSLVTHNFETFNETNKLLPVL